LQHHPPEYHHPEEVDLDKIQANFHPSIDELVAIGQFIHAVSECLKIHHGHGISLMMEEDN
jgi:hypothetical protein